MLSSSDSITGELLGDLELVRCRLISGLVLWQSSSGCVAHAVCAVARRTHSSLSPRTRFLRLPFSE